MWYNHLKLLLKKYTYFSPSQVWRQSVNPGWEVSLLYNLLAGAESLFKGHSFLLWRRPEKQKQKQDGCQDHRNDLYIISNIWSWKFFWGRVPGTHCLMSMGAQAPVAPAPTRALCNGFFFSQMSHLWLCTPNKCWIQPEKQKVSEKVDWHVLFCHRWRLSWWMPEWNYQPYRQAIAKEALEH